MPDPSPPFDDSSFREHARFVRSLAGALARDRDEADEVAARTFASAVEQRPRAGPTLRGWLASVARRALSRLRRDDARRGVHESAAARSERVDADPVDLAARSELSDRIALAFAQLDEPAKTTLFLRFFADLTPKQIAAREQIPVDTVKTRLKRGLAKLRARLDETSRISHDTRSARSTWRATALALARDGAPLLGITKAKGVAAAAAVFVIASAATLWRFERHERPIESSSVASVPPAAAASCRDDERAPPADAPDTAASPLAASATRRSEAPPLPFVSGVVVDEHGAPLVGVRVVGSYLPRIPTNASVMALLGGAQDPPRSTTLDFARLDATTLARTDANGRFVVRALPEFLAGLYFVASGRAPARCFDLSVRAEENQERRFTLERGCTVRGHIVDRQRRPIPGAALAVHEAEPPVEEGLHPARPLVPDGTGPPATAFGAVSSTDADGGFELLLPPRSFRLDAKAPGYVGDLKYSEGVDGEIEFTLWRNRAQLDVVDSRTGAPVPGIHALASREGEPESAECLVPSDAPPTSARLTVAAPTHLVLFAAGYHAKSIDLAVDSEGEPPQLTVALEPGLDPPSIAGTVRGGHTAQVVLTWLPPLPIPIDSRAGSIPAGFHLNDLDSLLKQIAVATSDADGHFAFVGIPPATYCLDVAAPGCTPRRRIVTAPVKDVAFDLVASAQLDVLVVDAAGSPRAGARVHVQSERDALAWSAGTGKDGVARFEDLPDGELHLVAARELHDRRGDGVVLYGSSDFPSRDDVTLTAGERRRVQIHLLEPIPVTLHVHDVDGRSIEGANVLVSLKRSQAPGELLITTARNLAGHVFETDVDGEAHLELWPSTWNIEVWANGHHFHVDHLLEPAPSCCVELQVTDD